MWKNAVDISQVVEIRAKTTVFFGVGAIKKISDIAGNLAAKKITKAIVVTGSKSHIKSGAWDVVKKALDEHRIAYVLYSDVTPNPTVDQLDQAAQRARKFGATAVIAIGGGSPIDLAKGVAVLLSYPDKTGRDLFEHKFIPGEAAPIVTVNLTHGTGTEIDRFAVVSIPEKNYKPAIAYDCIYPLFSIDDPALMTTLPKDQIVYVTVDAVNHVIEGATTNLSNPFAISLARETIDIIANYLPQIRKNPADMVARYYLLYASMIAGISFDNGLLHFTHALEHPLSGIKPELSHGLGLGMLLPAVVKQIYAEKPEVLAYILKPIVPGLKGEAEEAVTASNGVKAWLRQVGIDQTLSAQGFLEADLDRLTDLAFETPSLGLLLSLAPTTATREVVKAIYVDSFK